jgi:hypothetical protein
MIDKGKLDELLVKNWTRFIDAKRLMVRVLQDANAAADKFNIVTSGDGHKQMVQVSVSRFDPTSVGFVVWVEFSVPRDDVSYVGTAEYDLRIDGGVNLRQIIGTKFTKAGVAP